MRILFYADGRSPITVNWLHHWIRRGDEVHLDDGEVVGCRFPGLAPDRRDQEQEEHSCQARKPGRPRASAVVGSLRHRFHLVSR